MTVPKGVEMRDRLSGKRPKLWVGDKWVTHVWKQGFPVSTTPKAATLSAMKAAEEAGLGEVVHHEVVTTPEHEAAGEFVVVLLLHDKNKPTRAKKPKIPRERKGE
jgi:hypothetical protein